MRVIQRESGLDREFSNCSISKLIEADLGLFFGKTIRIGRGSKNHLSQSWIGLPAWSAIQEIGCLKPDMWVVAQGTGGVALSALKIAKAYGVKVALTSRSPQKFDDAYREGADFIIDTSSESHWSERFLAHTKGETAAQVLELIGGDNLKESLAVLGHGGQLHSIGFLESRYAEVDLIPLNVKKISINGISVGHRKALQRFVEAVDSRGIKPVVSQVFSFSQAPEALDAMKKGAFGNVVINVEG